VEGELVQPAPFDPDDWQFEMDSALLDVGQGPKKYQGVPLGLVLQSMAPLASAETVVVHTDGEALTLSLAEVSRDDDVRIFTILGDDDVSYALARISGEVLAPRLTRIQVRGP
jgi:hypothetical protein